MFTSRVFSLLFLFINAFVNDTVIVRVGQITVLTSSCLAPPEFPLQKRSCRALKPQQQPADLAKTQQTQPCQCHDHGNYKSFSFTTPDTPILSPAMPSVQESEAAHKLRPNGKQAACDPCRVRKVACDHARPACSRCCSKNRTGDCVYSATAVRKDAASSHEVPPAAVVVGEEPEPEPEPEPAVPVTPRPSKRMRLGYTSALEETQPNLVSTTQESPYGSSSHTDQLVHSEDAVFGRLPRSIREMCLEVLRALPGQTNAQMQYLDGHFEPKGWVHLAAHRIVQWLRVVLAESPSKSEQETLEHVAQIISNNTAKPLRGPYPNWETWLNAFVGPNTRWESIGLLWTHLERVSDILDALIPRKLVRTPANTSRTTAKVHLDYCIQLTKHFTDESDLLADLYRRYCTLVSLTDGELGE